MDLLALIERAREHYVDQFGVFVDCQKQGSERGAAEVKFEIPEPTALYRRLGVVDFVKNNNGVVKAIEFQPERILEFETFSAALGAMTVVVEALIWDNVIIVHDLPDVGSLDEWFEQWFDPDDVRLDPTAKFSGIIHSLGLTPGCITLDCGTAPPDSLWQLLEHLEKAGAQRITICTGASVH